MLTSSHSYSSTSNFVNQSSLTHGVYRLFLGNELVYVGHAMGIGVSIRSRLQDHFSGLVEGCLRSATSFDYETTLFPEAGERQILNEFFAKFGCLPRCNNVLP